MYKPVDHAVNFPKLEEEILAFWQENHIFEKSISQREGADDFSFYDGPPFATGLPHFGHFVPSTIKDIIPRYKTMKGKRVERRFGWDCHGLPIENLIEKELGLNSKSDIERYGIASFNEACRAAVLRYVREWRHVITRLGRWVDFDKDYKTMEPDYMETIWWVIKSLWEKELLYEGYYILPYCPRCATVLSNHELNLGGYKNIHDPAITVRFKIKGDKDLADGSTYFLAWTTTPWTLPSNLALAIGPDIEYALVQDGDERYILASSRLEAYYKSPNDYTVLCRQKGSNLLGIEYEPLFPYFADAPFSFRTYPGDFVSTQEGTGIVHTAPGFGEDDYRILKGSGVPVICPLDAECRFTSEVKDYAGMFVKDADKAIIDRLKAEGKLLRRDQILHSYPHCWRCDHPLIYRAVNSWFVDIKKIKKDMLDANDQITWVPSHIKTGRFGKWLEGAREWAISRNRYWGNPLPIWKCPECEKMICVGSRAELKELSGIEAQDLHKHFVDDIVIPCSCGSTMRRVPEVLDCWFESGAMPYAQNHYPFENKAFFDEHFPADFINEGLDQTRGWFYTLTILAAALFKKPAFQYCIVSGLVLAGDGKKMSKSLRNYTDPMKVINNFGADALRLFLVHSSVVKAEDLRYSDESVREVLKSIIIPLWNAYSFFVTYANIDGIKPEGAPQQPANALDQWILSASETLVEKVDAALGSYDLSRAVDPILDFIDMLNNWYIRRSRRRFWKSENDADKIQGYQSLYSALKTLVTVSAPFMPFTTDAIWQNLRLPDDPESVHLAFFPESKGERRNRELEYRMASVQHAVSMGRALRAAHGIKVRQPLSSVELITGNEREKSALLDMQESIREELNVKQVLFRDNEEELVHYEVKAKFRVLGKELGKDMKAAASAIEEMGLQDVRTILDGGVIALNVAGRTINITADKVEIRRIEKSGFKVLNEGTLTVALDTVITPLLLEEGDIRDLIRGVQNLRKDEGFAVSDRIILRVNGSSSLQAAWNRFSSFVASEVLASEAVWASVPEDATLIYAGEEAWKVTICRAAANGLKNSHVVR